ncbi:single-stranded DNA-binding protein WHY2, mitochondrial-like isoform X2 [Curcuma longa]|uniref:single-stranded DNA-binding protein WHY2, mitochondrial-like isoform X2 n=1 Tax=Curcuma longa TaxID=136217 RepID=UPI003D9E5CF1
MALSNLSRFLSSRNFSRIAEVKVSLWLSTKRGISTSGPDLATDARSTSFRRFESYTVFKGKAAMALEPILPTFHKVNSSKVLKRGCVLMTFWPAISTKKYDWNRRQAFALSSTEAGNLIALGREESCEFFHDPSKNSSLEGQVNKSLKVSPLGNDQGYFLNLMVTNKIKGTNERLSVPVTKAEFAVIRTILTYILPHILGWSQSARSQLPETAPNLHKQGFGMRPDPALEWEL